MVNSKELLQRYRVGQERAAGAIFDRYVARMRALARGRIGGKLRRRFDSDDVVQSAFRSFFVHAKEGEYQLSESGDLWRLLAGITLHKLHRQIERQEAAKRSVHRESSAAEFKAILAAHEPSAGEAAALIEELDLALDALDPDERIVLTSTLEGLEIEEIEHAIGKSARTVRRLLAVTRRKLEKRLLCNERIDHESKSADGMVHAPLIYADYLLEQMLGAGGMGKVYRAKVRDSGKAVAIKALHKSRQSDPRAIAQFAHEAEVLAMLRHPNIVGVHGLGRFPGGGYFFVMDFIDGVDLESRLRQGPLPLHHAIEIVKEVADAIQHAHDQGVVHCDLKPANILLDQMGRVYVSDFGFAFLIADSSKMSRQSIGGTAGYIAPEILLRKSKPTPAADVYALGMILRTLATGKTPNTFDPLHEKDHLAKSIDKICRRCVANDPEKRIPSARELLRVLRKLDGA